jgi:hypothetical protein
VRAEEPAGAGADAARDAGRGVPVDLAPLKAELHRLVHSYEYAWAMGSACEGGKGHPRIAAVRERVEDLRALIQEHET